MISSVAFGLETKCLGNPTNEFRKMASEVFDPPKFEILKFMFMSSFQDLSKMIGLCTNTKKTIDFFMGVIRNSVSYRETNKVQRNDFLQLLINSKNNDGMTMNDIAANSCKLKKI